MVEGVRRAIRCTERLNALPYDDGEGIAAAWSELTGQSVDPTFHLIPPVYSDCGLHLRIGRNVFVSQGCRLDDIGGIDLGDDVMLGPGVRIVSSGHPLDPALRRRQVTAAQIVMSGPTGVPLRSVRPSDSWTAASLGARHSRPTRSGYRRPSGGRGARRCGGPVRRGRAQRVGGRCDASAQGARSDQDDQDHTATHDRHHPPGPASNDRQPGQFKVPELARGHPSRTRTLDLEFA